MKTLNKSEDVFGSQHNNFIIPTVLRDDPREISFTHALIVSTVLHPIVIFLIWAILTGLSILGIRFPVFEVPLPKVKDIEFVLVNKTDQAPVNKNTKLRSDRNSRAGGKNNPNLALEEPEPSSPRSVPQAPAPRPTPKTATSKQQPIPPRPKPKQHNTETYRNIKAPIPTARMPRAISPNSSSQTQEPFESSLARNNPSQQTATGYSNGKSRYASGYSYGNGNVGNPSAGNPNGPPGLDVMREADMGPYVREMQRRIKKNWDPPRGNSSSKVVLFFKITRDGRVFGVSVHVSSGDPATDRAAISAVELTAPFRPLPPEFRGNFAQIDFTFDYNYFGVTKSQY